VSPESIHYPLCLQQMPFTMGDQVTQVVSEPQSQKSGRSKRNPDLLKVFGRYMAQYIVNPITLLEEPVKDIMSFEAAIAGMKGFKRLHFQNAAIRTRHDGLIQPITQPTALKSVGPYVGGTRYTGNNTAYIGGVNDIQVFEYFSDAPFIR
jgi:hypothetical protein